MDARTLTSDDWDEAEARGPRDYVDDGFDPEDDLAGDALVDQLGSPEPEVARGGRYAVRDSDTMNDEGDDADDRRQAGGQGDIPRRVRHTGPRGAADEILDELLPERFDWERLVRSYPIPALLVAAAGGFLLGRFKGVAVVSALSAFAADAVADNVNTILGDPLI